jgi:RimJ/RimL family protein N-acetyltransferase
MRWADPTEERAAYIAGRLRKEDEFEVWLSHRMTPYEAVLISLAGSDVCRCIESNDGEPLGVTGVCGDRIWMLGTDRLTESKQNRWELVVCGREWVDHCLEVVGVPIGNHVYAKNERSIRWLRHLGFTVEHPEPFGPSAALFCPFWREV